MRNQCGRRLSFALVGTVMWLLGASPSRAQSRGLDSRAVRAWAALLAAHDARVPDTTSIDSALASPVVQLRAAGVRVIGLNRVAARYDAARSLLRTGGDTAVRRDAAFALGLAADTASCGVLGESLADPMTGIAAAWALGEMGARCGSFASLFERASSAGVRAALLRVALKWTPFPDSIVGDAYRRASGNDERWAALYAFARARRDAGVGVALGASRSPAATIREVAARLLAVTTAPHADSAAAVARLVVLLRDPSAHVRIAVVRSLASYRELALPPLQRAWALERDANVRVTMVEALATAASDSAPVWGAWWLSDSTHMVRRTLIGSAWQAGAVPALERVGGESLFSHPDFRIRIAMINGAAVKHQPALAGTIAALGHDRDARVRASVISAMAGFAAPVRDSLGWRSLLESARTDADVGVRQSVLETVFRTAMAADVDGALDGYQRALADTSSDAREAALMVIASAWRRDSASFSDSLTTRLRSLAPSADPLLRQRVRTVSPMGHWAAATPSIAPAADYERIVREIVAPSLQRPVLQLIVETERGPVRIALDGVQAPMTADHFIHLARAGYFRNLRFHRVVPAFVAQGGDPRGDGSGGPGYAIRDELNRSDYTRGAVGMALSGPDTGGSQFFLTLAPQPHLNGHYTVFGRVVAGRAAMDALVQGDTMRNIRPIPE